MTTSGTVLIDEFNDTEGFRFVSDTYVWSEEDKARLCAVMSKIFEWKHHIVVDAAWVSTLKRDLGQEVERAVTWAVARSRTNQVEDLPQIRYDSCLDWIVDRAINQLIAPDLFNDGSGI
jgi:hypothetical protein